MIDNRAQDNRSSSLLPARADILSDLDMAYRFDYLDEKKYLYLKCKYENVRAIMLSLPGERAWGQEDIVSFHHYSFLDHRETVRAVTRFLKN